MFINKQDKFEERYAFVLIMSANNNIYKTIFHMIEHSKDMIDKITAIEEKLKGNNPAYIDKIINEKLAFGLLPITSIIINSYDFTIGETPQKSIDKLMKRRINKKFEVLSSYNEVLSTKYLFGMSFIDIRMIFRLVRKLIMQTTMKEHTLVLFNMAIKELYNNYNCDVVLRFIALSSLLMQEHKTL